MAMVFTLVELAQTWINEHVQLSQDQPDEDEDGGTETNTELEPERLKPVLDAKASGGRWHFVIGLVVRAGCWRLLWHVHSVLLLFFFLSFFLHIIMITPQVWNETSIGVVPKGLLTFLGFFMQCEVLSLLGISGIYLGTYSLGLSAGLFSDAMGYCLLIVSCEMTRS